MVDPVPPTYHEVPHGSTIMVVPAVSDPELQAVQFCVTALASLPPDTRARIAGYLFERYDDPDPAT